MHRQMLKEKRNVRLGYAKTRLGYALFSTIATA